MRRRGGNKQSIASRGDGLDQYRTPTDNRALLNRASALAAKNTKAAEQASRISESRRAAEHLLQQNRQWAQASPYEEDEISGSIGSDESDDGEVVDLEYIVANLPSVATVRGFMRAQVRAVAEDYSDGEFDSP
jgi:hypothetical protein